jgi:uncharacterized protein (TIGR01777 family)
MRVGVTGSSGFIGSALVDALRERGDDVIAFVRPTANERDANAVRWNPSLGLVDANDLRRVGGFDAVVNLAGAGIADRRWTASRKIEIMQSRIRSTELLAHALAGMSSGTPMVASGSAVGYYGSRGDRLLDETSPRSTDFLANVCFEWEKAIEPLEDSGTTVARLRTGIVLASHGGALKKQLPLFRLGLGGPLGSGRQWLSPISLRDEVRAILWVLDHRVGGPVNLVAPAPITNLEFTRELGRVLHRPTLARVPSVVLKFALGSELTSEAVLASQRVVPKVLLDRGFTFLDSDAASCLRTALAVSL